MRDVYHLIGLGVTFNTIYEFQHFIHRYGEPDAGIYTNEEVLLTVSFEEVMFQLNRCFYAGGPGSARNNGKKQMFVQVKYCRLTEDQMLDLLLMNDADCEIISKKIYCIDPIDKVPKEFKLENFI